MACVVLMLASCTTPQHYGGGGYGGGYPNNGGGRQIDVPRTAALVAAGVAGLSLYHYSRQKDRRKDAERALRNERDYNNGYQGGRQWMR